MGEMLAGMTSLELTYWQAFFSVNEKMRKNKKQTDTSMAGLKGRRLRR